jgi:hypothetical protein
MNAHSGENQKILSTPVCLFLFERSRNRIGRGEGAGRSRIRISIQKPDSHAILLPCLFESRLQNIITGADNPFIRLLTRYNKKEWDYGLRVMTIQRAD